MAKSPTVQNKIDLLRTQRSATNWYRKDAPYVWPDFRAERPQYQIVDFQSYVAEGFNINTLVYSAIMYKVRAMYQVPLRAYTGDEDHPEPLPLDHPLSQLVRRPNIHQSFAEFQGLQHVYLNLSGNSYTYLDQDSPDELPRGLYPLRPDRVFIVPKQGRKKLTEGALLGYLYVPEGTSAWVLKSKEQRTKDVREGKVFPILPQNMLHVKFPNPGDPLEGMGYGLAPLSPAAKSVDVDNKVTDFLNMFFKNGTMMMGVLSYDVPLDENTIPGIRTRWQELYGGYENWTNVGILDQGGKYQRITPTFDEMGFGELDERSETRALGPFGVPPILVGARIGLLRSTYSNFEQARKLCWEETLVPEANLFLVEYRDKLTVDDAFVGWDYTKVPAMRQNLDELSEVWARLVKGGVPKDIASAVTGLDIPPLLDGQVIYMEANLMPVGEQGQPSRLWPGQQLLPLGEAIQEDEEPLNEDAEKLWKRVKKKYN